VLTPTGAAASDGASALARVGPDGRFTIPDVVPGRYRPAILAGGTWRARQFEIQGRDALDTLLDVEAGHALSEAIVTLTTRLASVTGVLTDAAGQPASDYTIILFSEDPAFWTPRSRRTVATRPATDGRFALADLPAGRYRMAAVEDIEDGQWFNPTLLTQLAGSAIAVDVAEGGIYTQDIRLAR